MELLKCNDLCLGYEVKTVAEHISFTVNEGDYLGIVGENGSGKSTLVKTILGLQPPLAGSVEKSETLKKAGGAIGYLPQQNLIQRDFPATAEEIVRLGFLAKSGLRPFYTRAEKQRALVTMGRLGVLDLRKRCFSELSGGQQQRVLLARALLATGNLLLLDEPVAGLDPKAANELYGLIRSLNREGIAILMVSHDIRAVLSYATHILHVLHGGAWFGTAEEYAKSGVGKLFAGEKQ